MQTFASMRETQDPHLVLQRTFELISPEMALVEKEFERQASSNIQVIDYLGGYLRASGGKRVRPALLVLAHAAINGGERNESVIRLATVMEMLHTATLVHDDIIDNADLRRNRSSVNAKFGNQTAVLMGDWLYMSAFETTVKERSLEILDILTRVTRKMTEGELIQLTTVGRADITDGEYLDILRRKTAFLFSACCEIGAILGGGDEAQQAAMRDYGMELGIAFQLSDDILDLTSETDRLGKPAGSDLLEGKLTLPMIYLLEREPALVPKVEKLMADGAYSVMSRAEIMEKLAAGGIIQQAKSLAHQHSIAAIKSLAVLPDSEYRTCLEDVLTFVTERKI